MDKPCTRCEQHEAEHSVDVAGSDAYGMDLCTDCLDQFKRLMDLWMDEREASILLAIYYGVKAATT